MRTMLLAAMGACALIACGGTRSAADVKSLPVSAANIRVPVERPVAQVNVAIRTAAQEMDLSIEEAPADRGTWVFMRGKRLEYGELYLRVDVEPLGQGSTITVFAVPLGVAFGDTTGETVSKPRELAYRITTLALAGPR